MSKKCVAFSKSKIGFEIPNNRKAFYAGWDAALAEQAEQSQLADATLEPVAKFLEDNLVVENERVDKSGHRVLEIREEELLRIMEIYAALVAENTNIKQQREIVRLNAIIEEQANGAQNLVLAEREACAKVCEELPKVRTTTDGGLGVRRIIGKHLAAAIRERSANARARGEK